MTTIRTNTGRELELITDHGTYRITRITGTYAGHEYTTYLLIIDGREITSAGDLDQLKTEAPAVLDAYHSGALGYTPARTDDTAGTMLDRTSPAPAGTCHYCGLPVTTHDCH